ncbi:hypothetical protein WK13_34695 [Burkholderia ubonensis]|uniref:hypothetical protein n=1 Tax=Burkholderia ubonensis TaxID=101571 RepID=UPI00075AD505|nr:hypothetical protein [Burkholderia ubonensis]KVR21689.1 hypothetical protein WK13_34695 [Burkholderia ubonensis]
MGHKQAKRARRAAKNPPLMKKNDLMKLVESGRCREVFSHTLDGQFDVTAMREWARKHVEPVLTPIEPMLAFMRDRVLEDERVMALTYAQWHDDPALAVRYEDGVHLLIDGHHRIERRRREGLTTALIVVVPYANVVRPDMHLWWKNPALDWGDAIGPDGRIVKRT